MPNILFLVESYFHNPQPNGICVKKVVDELVKHPDVCVSVITSKTVSGQPNHEKINGVEVYSFNRDFGNKLLNMADKKRGLLKNILTIGGKFVHKLWFHLCIPFWPLRSPLLVAKYYIKACRLHHKRPFDSVIGVYCLMEEIAAARLLKKKYPNISFSIYSLDAFSGRRTPVIYGNADIAKKSIIRWEKKVFSSADNICIMASHQQHYINSGYNYMRDKIRIMDIPLLNVTNGNHTTQNRVNSVKKIVFTGSAGKFAGNPEYFLKLLNDINQVEFHIYGIVSDYVEQVIKKSGMLCNKVFLHGKVPHEQIGQIQRNADFLINFGCENPNMIPCKIFEYISALKPIIGFYRIKNDPSIPYLKNYPNIILLSEDEKNIIQNREALDRFIKNCEYTTPSPKEILETYWNNTVYPMVELVKGGQVFEQKVNSR